MEGVDARSLVRRMDLFTLRLFMSVVEEGQLARAASREHIVASAVTKRIRELEELLGIQLFVRTPTGTTLTAAGAVVARHVERIFHRIELMRDEIDEVADGVRGHVRLCATESIVVEFLADEIHSFTRDHPLIEIALSPRKSPELLANVEIGASDIAIFSTYSNTRELISDSIATFPFRTDQLVALVPRGHPLAGRDGTTLAELVGAGLIGLRPQAPLMVHLHQLCRREGVDFVPRYEVSTNDAARALVRAGLGVSLQPQGVLRGEDHAQIVIVPLDQDWAMRQMYIALHARKPPSAATRAFLAQISRQAGRPDGCAAAAEWVDSLAPAAAALEPPGRRSPPAVRDPGGRPDRLNGVSGTLAGRPEAARLPADLAGLAG